MVLSIQALANELLSTAAKRSTPRRQRQSAGSETERQIQQLLQSILGGSGTAEGDSLNVQPGSFLSGNRNGTASPSLASGAMASRGSNTTAATASTTRSGFANAPASAPSFKSGGRLNPFRAAAAPSRPRFAPTSAPSSSNNAPAKTESVFRAPSADADSYDTAQRRGNCGLVSFMNGLHSIKPWGFIQNLMKKFKTGDMEKVADGLGRRAGAMGDGGSTRSTWARMAKMVGIEGKAGQATLSSINKILDTGRPVEMSLNAGVFWGMKSRGRGQDHAVLAIGHEARNGKDGMWIVDSGKPNGGPRWYSMDLMKRALGGSRKSDVFVFKDKHRDGSKLPKSLRDKLFKNRRETKNSENKMASTSKQKTSKQSTSKQPSAKRYTTKQQQPTTRRSNGSRAFGKPTTTPPSRKSAPARR